jgi:methionyl-tRNA synthetase
VNSKEKILVTSALPYANGPLHLGQIAGAYLPADIYVRYQRLKRRDVIFISGTDEHGVPITITADKRGITPQEVVDYYHQNHKEAFERFGIRFDNFSRTSLRIHHRTAQEFFLRLHRKNALKIKTEEQFYCEKCERFLADRYIEGTCPNCGKDGARGDQCESCGTWLEPRQLIDPRCAVCGSTPVIKQTSHWYLPLGKFQDKIQKWIGSKTHWRDNVINFCNSWFKKGLEDRAITRDMNWGISVPLKNIEGKVLYVWFEAPIGYISSTREWALRIGEPDRWKDYWLDPETQLVHFIGKDNIVFHAIFWPIVLMERGEYVLPGDIPANEFLNIAGSKISTSRNYAIWLDDYLNRFPPDPMRYTLASLTPESKDSDFSWKDFQARYNFELADILGNFVNRTLTFVEKYFDGRIPVPSNMDRLDNQAVATMEGIPRKIGVHLEAFEFRLATKAMMDLARFSNKYFNDKEPWVTRLEAPKRCATTLYLCLELTRTLGVVISPFMPFSAERIWQMLSLKGTAEDQEWDALGKLQLRPGHLLGKPQILYPKIPDEVIEEEIGRLNQVAADHDGENTAVNKVKETLMDIVTFEDFKKLDLRVAKIVEVSRVENTDKLLRIQIDLGAERRQIVAGLAKAYRPEEMVGKSIVVVTNLEPAVIRGVESKGMLLAASSGDKVLLLTLDGELEAGAKVS